MLWVRQPFFESSDRMSLESGHGNVIRKYVFIYFRELPRFCRCPRGLKWQRLFQKWQRLFQMATTVYERENCGGEFVCGRQRVKRSRLARIRSAAFDQSKFQLWL